MKVFHALLTASVRSTFHKLNVHAGEQCHYFCTLHHLDVKIFVHFSSTNHPNIQYFLTAMRPVDLSEQLKGAFEQAHQLHVANNEASTPFLRVPNVTVSILDNGCSVMIYC